MTIKSDVAFDGDKELKENWPITEGLTLGTTKLSKEPNLKAEGLQYKDELRKSNVPSRNKVML